MNTDSGVNRFPILLLNFNLLAMTAGQQYLLHTKIYSMLKLLGVALMELALIEDGTKIVKLHCEYTLRENNWVDR
jgi:hypothetical protein